MTTEQLNRWLSLLANIGVIAGIVFLAIELRHNNTLMVEQANRDFVEQRAESLARWADDEGGLMQLRVRASSGEALTIEEQIRLDYDMSYVFVKWEWEYRQFQAGRLEYIPVRAFRDDMRHWPYWVERWNEVARNWFQEDFVRFVDEEVIAKRFSPEEQGE